MSLASGLSRHPVMHPHDGHSYSQNAAGQRHEKPRAPSYYISWLINQAEMSLTEYSPDYNVNSGSDSTCSLDPPHSQPYGTGAGDGGISVSGIGIYDSHQHAHSRSVKRRPTANRKERRRTQSINSAFAELRDCIPNVPADTKLSKIKTLRLATSYISYLMDILEKDGHYEETRAAEVREDRRRADAMVISKITSSSSLCYSSVSEKKSKGRTGWPQHVWALKLKTVASPQKPV